LPTEYTFFSKATRRYSTCSTQY